MSSKTQPIAHTREKSANENAPTPFPMLGRLFWSLRHDTEIGKRASHTVNLIVEHAHKETST